MEKVDDPKTWRNKVKRMATGFRFVDPTTFDWDPGRNDEKMVYRCKRLVKESDGLLIRYMEGQNTCGTWHEQQIAWEHGLKIAIVSDMKYSELFIFAREHSHSVSDNFASALGTLTEKL